MRVMGILIYQGTESLSTRSNYHRLEIKQVSEEEVRRQNQERQQAVLQQITPDYSRWQNPAEQERRAKAADPANISLTFHKTDSFDYLGSGSGLEKNPDVMKAVSDMRKDEVLQEYQCFVGNSQNFAFQSEDGVVLSRF